jgi:hypothetical protein
MRTALLAAALLLAPALRGAEAALLSPSAQSREDFVAASASGLDASLSLLDGGPLTHALHALALSGTAMRLLLDPAQADTRREGAALAQLTPTAQVRWLPRAGSPMRRLLRPDAQLLWRGGAEPSRADGALSAARQRFDADWARAAQSLPEAQRLEDELKRLPDPSEGTPHLSRRKDAVDRSKDDADPEDQR